MRKVLGTLLLAAATSWFTLSMVQAQSAMTSELSHITNERFLRLVESIETGRDHVVGELLVKFRSGAAASDRVSVLRLLRLDQDQGEERWLGDILHIQNPAIDDAVWAAELLRRQPEVEFAEPNYISHVQSQPNDPSYSRQWNFSAIDVPRAWDINPGGRGDVLVAVIDSGLTTTQQTLTFPIFDGRSFFSIPVPFARTADFDHSRILPGRDFTFWNFMWDTSGHGTHVAGTIAQATNNGVGLAGIAYNARLLPMKACLGYWDWQLRAGVQGLRTVLDPRQFGGECLADAWVAAVRAAADVGAKVINLSFGGTQPSTLQRDAILYAVQRGAFVAIAAGNNGDRGNPTFYPAAYTPVIDGAVSVAAINRNGRRPSYSNYGSYVELSAPGGEGEDVTGSVWQAFPLEADMDWRLLRPRFDRYQEKGIQGTSMASPHVAAVATLLYTQGVKTPQGIEAALKKFAREAGPAGRDDEYGFGIIDARATLRGLGVSR